MNSLLLDIQNLDFKKTRSNVHHTFKKYKRLLGILPVRSMPSVTQSFSYIPPTTNVCLNGIEAAAAKNIEREKMLKEREEILEQMNNAIENLKPDERYIIVHKYLQDQRGIDYEIYTDLGYGKTKYHEVKNDAIIRLAFYLGIEVYEGSEQS